MGDDERLAAFVRKGFVRSEPLPFVGEEKEIAFKPDTSEGVSGVWASERERCREGVFGWNDIVAESRRV